jgi:hypothetical protein
VTTKRILATGAGGFIYITAYLASISCNNAAKENHHRGAGAGVARESSLLAGVAQ